MARGGNRPGSGRPATPRPDRRIGIEHASRMIEALNRKKSSKDSIEVRGWRDLWEAKDLRIRLDTRKFLYDKRDGKAVQPIESGSDVQSEIHIHNHIERPKR